MNEEFVDDLNAEVDEVWLSLSLVRVHSEQFHPRPFGRA